MSRYFLSFILLAGAATQAQQPMNPTALGTTPLTSEAAGRTNTLSYGVNVSSDFDDNATNPTNISQGETSFRAAINPQSELSIDRTHFRSSFFYSPGFVYNSNISAYNSSSQAASADIAYLFTKRLSLHFANSFSLVTNPYTTAYTNSDFSSFGILNRPNQSVFGANVRSTTELSQADILYELGRHTTVGIGGNFTSLRYRPVTEGASGSPPSIESRGWAGHAFYSHQLTAKYSLGIQYAAQDFSSDQSLGHFSTLSHQVLGFVTVSFRPTVQLSLFAGPQFSEIDDNVTGLQTQLREQLNQSSFAGGSSLSWQGEHSGASASFVQQVNDSGLNGTGSALVRTVNAQVQHRIGKSWNLHFYGNYVSNNQRDPVSPLLLTDSATAGLGLSKMVTPHLTLSLSAMRQQFFEGTAITFGVYGQRSHDVGTISFLYNFTRPIGR